MTLNELIEALENARVSDEMYETEYEADDELRASVDGLILPIEKVEVINGRVLIHIDMYNGAFRI
jgi:hypothetical protein